MNEKEFASFLDFWIEDKREEIVDCLLELIRIPSVGSEPAEGIRGWESPPILRRCG